MKIHGKIRDGYLGSYAAIGQLDGGEEFEVEDDFMPDQSRCYRLIDGVLRFDPVKWFFEQDERTVATLRLRREEECFAVINRSPLWFNTLTEEQKSELQIWYQAWLDVTETRIVPGTPTWLK